MMLLKGCTQYLENSAVTAGLERSVFIPNPKKGNAKEFSTNTQLHSIASKAMLKILKAMLQQYVNQEPPEVKAGFGKGRGPRDQIANIH